jgi:small subunit ribosomal protein S6
LKEYDIAVLYHPDLEIDIDATRAKVEKIITDNGGVIKETESWGKRRLAYEIVGVEHAIYYMYLAELPAEAISKINNILNITSEVIRFLITTSDAEVRAGLLKKKEQGSDDSRDGRGDREDRGDRGDRGRGRDRDE